MRKLLRLRRSDLLLFLAGLVLLAQLVAAVAIAAEREHTLLAAKRERQLRVLVAGGDDVAAKTRPKAQERSAPDLARTGVDVTSPLSLGLVLMLDGALLLVALRPKRRPFSSHVTAGRLRRSSGRSI